MFALEDRGRLSVVLTGETARHVPTSWVELIPRDGGKKQAFQPLHDGPLEFPVCPGRYGLVVTPRAVDRFAFNSPIEYPEDIEIVPRGSMALYLRVPVGGRLRVRAELTVPVAEGRAVDSAQVRYRRVGASDDGARLWFEYDEGGTGSYGNALPLGPTLTSRDVLLPGDYELEARLRGFEPERAHVAIEAGKTAPVAFRFGRAR